MRRYIAITKVLYDRYTHILNIMDRCYTYADMWQPILFPKGHFLIACREKPVGTLFLTGNIFLITEVLYETNFKSDAGNMHHYNGV